MTLLTLFECHLWISGFVPYLAVLFGPQEADGQLSSSRYVLPIRTYFAWLPEQLALTYCRAALEMRPPLPYGVHHLQGRECDFQHFMVFQNIYHIGDSKSAQELEVFLRMPRERLGLCCGIQCTDSLHPNGPRQRRKLFTAALKLLRVCNWNWNCLLWEWGTKGTTSRPLAASPTGRWTRSSYFECYCDPVHRIGCPWRVWSRQNSFSCRPSGGVTGLWSEPPANGSHQRKCSSACSCWTFGFLAASWSHSRQDGATGRTLCSNRNQVIRQVTPHWMRFQQKCSQQLCWPFSGGQQKGNMEEAASVARTPATCLEVWSGDHGSARVA